MTDLLALMFSFLAGATAVLLVVELRYRAAVRRTR